MKKLLMCAVLAGGLGFAALAHADTVKVGTLTCDEAGGWGIILGSSHAVRCTFENGDRIEHYTGEINKFGVDIGYQTGGVIIWGVIAPSAHPAHGALAGHYVGATAGASVGVGVGANALVGGFDRSITLQPISIEGNEGLNIAAGVGELTLHAAAGH